MNNSYTEPTHVRVDYQKLHLVACTAAESRYESTESEKSTVKDLMDYIKSKREFKIKNDIKRSYNN